MPTTDSDVSVAPDADAESDVDVSGVGGEGGIEADDTVDRALGAFQAGEPVLVHDADDREGETDIVYPAEAMTPASVARLRNDAGGLVCLALADEVATALSLPFLDSVFDHPAAATHDLGYDSRSSFSLPVNHRDTFTGITDADRALTITRIADVARAVTEGADYDAADFAEEFRTPGHVHLLRAAAGLLSERRGHTELGIVLAEAAGVAPAVVVCEMLDDETGDALSTADAEAYARQHDLVYVEGAALVDRLG